MADTIAYVLTRDQALMEIVLAQREERVPTSKEGVLNRFQ